MAQNENIERVATWLKELGVNVTIGTFESRVKIQKFAYLFQELFGEKLYKDTKFHTKGPYSKTLEIDYYSHPDVFSSDVKIALNQDESREIIRLKSEGFDSVSALDLEIMASLEFLKVHENYDDHDAITKLQERKPYLKLQDIISGQNKLKDFMLTESKRKELLKILEKEMLPFEDASMTDLKDSLKAAE